MKKMDLEYKDDANDIHFVVEDTKEGNIEKVQEGVLFAFKGEKIEVHIGTSDPKRIAALISAATMVCEAAGVKAMSKEIKLKDGKTLEEGLTS